MKRHKSIYPIVLVNNRGKVMHIPGHLTLKALAKMSCVIKLVPRGTPLRKGEWRDTVTPDFVLPSL